MIELKKYIFDVLGIEVIEEKVEKNKLIMLPLYLKENYNLVKINLLNRDLVIAESININEFTVMQTKKHTELINDLFNQIVVLTAKNIDAQTRKRLIEKGVNFIVPGKQLFLPDLLIDLREDFRVTGNNAETEKLLPSAQLLVFYWILHRNKKPRIEDMTFQELAELGKYSKMTVTFIAENLKQNDVCTIVGEKEKYLKFNHTIPETWNMLENNNKFVNPVIKRFYIDLLTTEADLLISYESALAEFSDMNPSRQEYRAIYNRDFYKLLNNNAFPGLNEKEGEYCLEVWKYMPLKNDIFVKNNQKIVDPLSLYQSLKDNKDDRIQLALEQIIQKYIW